MSDKSQGRGSGFPHSEISGSKGARTSPELIAACHVLLSLPAPRHPSEALMRLIVLNKTHAREKGRRPIDAGHDGSRTHAGRSLHRQTMSSYTEADPQSAGDAGPTLPSRCQRMGVTDPLHLRKEPVIHANVFFPHDRPDAVGWWSRTGSNRRPHACKARALPTELRPQGRRPMAHDGDIVASLPRASNWWAQADSNRRPHAYQACALTN